jgi:hypothetical protein
LLISAALAALVVAPAAQASGAGALMGFSRANQDLQEAIAAADTAGQAPPSLANPDTAPMIRAAFDVAAADAAPDDDLGSLLQICGAASKSLQAYALFGLARVSVDPHASGDAAQTALAQLVGQNAIRFQDETAMAFRFNVACAGREVPATERFISALNTADMTPERKAGLKQLRRGMASVVSGLVLMQSDPIRDENRAAVLDEGLKHIDAFAAAITPDDRKRVIDQVDRVSGERGVSDEAKAKLGKIRVAMSRTDCSAICSN